MSCCVGLAAASAAVQPSSGLLIMGGTVIDGTGGPSARADVRIRGDEIVEVGPRLAAVPGERTIDAAGLTVAPGFIDMHSHAAGGIDAHPDAESQIRQGITTAVVGQDGGGTLPVSGFFDDIASAHPAINFAVSVGHGTVRSLVMGADFRRPATPAEIDTMAALVDRGMRDGAIGLSTGLEYDPGFYAEPAEVVALARVAAKYDGLYSSHVRDEENAVLDAWREAIDVGRKAGIRVEISHAKLASKPVWGRADEALGLRRSTVPLVALVAGVTGAVSGYALQWWTVGVAWPLNVGNRPPHSAPAFIPVTFELGVLFAALSIFLGLLFAYFRFPRVHHPVFEVEAFRSASIDALWLSAEVDAAEADGVARELRGLGARQVSIVGEETR